MFTDGSIGLLMNLVSCLINKTRTIYFYENIYSLQFHTFTQVSLESGPSRDPDENLICIVQYS